MRSAGDGLRANLRTFLRDAVQRTGLAGASASRTLSRMLSRPVEHVQGVQARTTDRAGADKRELMLTQPFFSYGERQDNDAERHCGIDAVL